MKTITIFATLFLATLVAEGQIPTFGTLAAQYDMTTITGGTTLVDLSGNGNNGTLNGTTPGPFGVTFNGTSDYISLPAIVGNSDVTAIVVFEATGVLANRMLWTELTAAGVPGTEVRTDRGLSGTASTSGVATNFSTWNFHTATLSRSGPTVGFRLSDLPNHVASPGNVGANATVTSTCGGIGAQVFGASCTSVNSYFSGTIAYILIYKAALNNVQMGQVYTALRSALSPRGLYLRDLPSVPLSVNSIWQRQGAATQRVTGLSNDGEPTVIIDGNPQLLTGSTKVFKLWQTCSDSIDMCYAESATGLAPWTVYGANGILSSLYNYHRGFVLKAVSGTYFYYGRNQSTNQDDVFTSPDGVNWTLAATNIVPFSASGWDKTDTSQPNITAYQPAADPYSGSTDTTIYVIYENASMGNGYLCGGATSPDGITFTKVAANPLAGEGSTSNLEPMCTAGQMYLRNGTWYLWGHADPGEMVSQAALTRWHSSAFNSKWSFDATVLRANASDESTQVADPSILDVDSGLCPLAQDCTYIYYEGYNGPQSTLKLAIAPIPMGSLVLTDEGTTSGTP